MINLKQRMVTPQIGLLPIGHFYYWDQFPQLKEMGYRMYDKLRQNLTEIGDIIASDLVDTMEKAQQAGEFFRQQDIDILIVFPFGYTPSMCVVPAVQRPLVRRHEAGGGRGEE